MKKISVVLLILFLNTFLFSATFRDKRRAMRAYRIAKKYIRRGNYVRAQRFLVYAHKKYPEHEIIFARLVNVLKRNKDYKTLVRFYAAYTDKKTNNARINSNMGTFAMKAKMWLKAIKYLQRAVKLKPDLYKAVYDLSLSYLRIKKYQQCIKYSLLALKKNYNPVDVLRNLVKAHMQIDLNDAAILYAKELVKRTKSNDAFALDSLAVLYAKIKDYKKAIATIELAIKVKKTALFTIRLEKYKKLLAQQEAKNKKKKTGK